MSHWCIHYKNFCLLLSLKTVRGNDGRGTFGIGTHLLIQAQISCSTGKYYISYFVGKANWMNIFNASGIIYGDICFIYFSQMIFNIKCRIIFNSKVFLSWDKCCKYSLTIIFPVAYFSSDLPLSMLFLNEGE